MKKFILLFVMLFLIGCSSQQNQSIEKGNVIFIHPDGTSLANWIGMRMLYYGPDAESNWDKLPSLAIYTPHTSNTLTPSSNAGATMHAYGKKVVKEIFPKADKELGKKLPITKKDVKLDGIDPKEYSDIRINVYTQPKMTSLGKKTSSIMQKSI